MELLHGHILCGGICNSLCVLGVSICLKDEIPH